MALMAALSRPPRRTDVSLRVWTCLGGLAATSLLVACGPISDSKSAESSLPSQLEPVAGARVNRVVLTAQAAALLGIKTDVVRKASAGSAQSTVVPAAALVYESDGTVWVYTTVATTSPKAPLGALTFVREPVTVARLDGDTATLLSGPPAGTAVVIVGTAELLGTEYRVAGGG